MKNTILKTAVCVTAVIVGTSVFAGNPYHGGPGPGCYRGNSGVRLAADIVGLVGASLDILRGPVVVYGEPCPVYTAPCAPVYPAPVVYTAPVYCPPPPPPPRPYFRPCPPPRHFGPGPGCPGRGPGPGRGPCPRR